MTELKLRRTWYEISEYLHSNESNPLRIAKLINRVPRCRWTFTFRFDKTNRMNLDIDCDSELSDNQAIELLDGSLDELLFAETVYLRQAGTYLEANTAELLEMAPTSNLLVLRNTEKPADSLLSLNAFCRTENIPREIHADSFSFVHRYFLENTWLGSLDSTDSMYEVCWDAFKEVMRIQPGNRYEDKLQNTDGFTTQATLHNSNGDHIGEASFQTSPSLENDEIYTSYGPLARQPRESVSRRHGDPHWIVEIGSHELSQAIIQRRSVRRLLSELSASVNDALDRVMHSDTFLNYKQELERTQQTVAVNRLKRRQERARSEARVIFEGEPVMLVPKNENEVLALLCKLESRQALPFREFLLWEYTARVGIDAIGTYQIRETDVPSQFASIEVEYFFENFIDHEHPHSQVNLVVCWAFRDGDAPAELRQHGESKYLFEYRNDHSITVVVLSNIPNLQIQQELDNVQ